jgi:hypothetical protein
VRDLPGLGKQLRVYLREAPLQDGLRTFLLEEAGVMCDIVCREREGLGGDCEDGLDRLPGLANPG